MSGADNSASDYEAADVEANGRLQAQRMKPPYVWMFAVLSMVFSAGLSYGIVKATENDLCRRVSLVESYNRDLTGTLEKQLSEMNTRLSHIEGKLNIDLGGH